MEIILLFNVGDYIHAELPSVINGKGEKLILVGTVTEINDYGHLILDSHMIVYPEHAVITVLNNVSSIERHVSRENSKRNHPAGRNL